MIFLGTFFTLVMWPFAPSLGVAALIGYGLALCIWVDTP